MRRGLIGGVVLAVFWFICGWVPYALSSAGGSLATLGQFVPSPLARGVFGSPVVWAVIVQVLMGVALIAGFGALASQLSAGRFGFAANWLAAILTAFAIGAALDLGNFSSWVGSFGVRGAAGTMGAAPLTTLWAVLVGWIPALVSARRVHSHDSSATPTPRRPGRNAVAVSALIAVVALIGLPFASLAGDNATQERLRDEAAAAQELADPNGPAFPDPDATGEAVKTAAPSDGRAAEGACTSANTTILAPAPEAATGHRGQWISLVNVSEEPCVVEGYPDVAYGDQNGHALDVAVEHGGSFMAQDPGVTPVTLQPGEAASAVIGWDANSVNEQLAASSVWIAVTPGEERLSWDISLDIVPGATVHVTAWQAEAPAGS
ncbi:DUF4232 domain-containing protein [Microbacterium sp. NPDC056234]|uniref:DUF4232 domain-containing protein n=1 Tax=Microbacterium sp. NPDC056234 TaxID=3345757 RepID=UPI0035D6BF64